MNFASKSSTIVVVDIQDRLSRAVPALDAFMPKVRMMLEAAKILNIDVIVTEQYPKGLGHTVEDLASLFDPDWPIIEKTAFSCFGEPEFRQELRKSAKKTVILMGIECHVCVLQTAFDLLNEDYNVVLLADAVASRNSLDCSTAIELMRERGVWVTTAESLLFSYLRNANHPDFKSISKLVR